MENQYIEDDVKVWRFWGTFLWGMVIALLIGIGQLLPLFIYMLAENMEMTSESFLLLAERTERDALLLSYSAIGSALFVVPLVFGIAKLKKGSVLKEYFDLNGFTWKVFGLWMLVLIGLLFFETFAIEALGVAEIPSFMMNIEYPSENSKWLLLFAVAVMAPIVEEVVFRGFLLKGFSQSFMGVWGAIVLTSALWAVIHLQYEFAYVAVIFGIGLAFGYAKVRTNSLYIPILMHMLMNLIAVGGLFYEKGML